MISRARVKPLSAMLVWPVLGLLAAAACGSGSPALARTPSTRAVGAAPVSAPPAPAAAPTNTAPAAPSPSPPLLVVRAPNGAVGAATIDGTWLWSFDPHVLGVANEQLVTAGPNLIAYGSSGPSSDGGTVAVVDRTGHVFYRGIYTAGARPTFLSDIRPDPTGTRWAWSTLDSALSTPQTSSQPWVSSVWIGGIGMQSRKLKTWTEPNGTEIDVRQWSDQGIVLLRLASTCGWQPQSSSLLDPGSTREEPLFGADLLPLDVHAGVHVAMDGSGTGLRLEGSASGTYTYELLIQGARVNPSGTRVEVSTLSMSGCGGVFKAGTGVIGLTTGRQTMLAGFFAGGWLDDDHLVGRTAMPAPVQSTNWGASVQIADLTGHVTDVVRGNPIGVIRG
jgi:hypothetical protein